MYDSSFFDFYDLYAVLFIFRLCVDTLMPAFFLALGAADVPSVQTATTKAQRPITGRIGMTAVTAPEEADVLIHSRINKDQ